MTIESAFELMLVREKTIASSESSFAVFLEKWFGGKVRLTCGERPVSRDDETDRLMPMGGQFPGNENRGQ